jgi:hypothetical protein
MTLETTLLDLVTAVNEVADSEDEAVATIVHLVSSGKVRLGGTFRGARLEICEPAPRTAHVSVA